MKEHKISLTAGKRAEATCAFILRFLLYHAVSCTVLCSFSMTEHTTSRYVALFGIIIPMCYLAFVRKFVKFFAASLLLQIPVVLAALVVGNTIAEKAVITACMIVMMIASVSMSMTERKNKNNCPSVALLVVLVICYFVGHYQEDAAIVSIVHNELLLYIVIYLVHESLHNTTEFIEIHKDTANFPVGQMTIVSRLMVVLLLTVLVAAMLVFPKMNLDVLLMPIVQLLGKFLAWLLSFIKLPEASQQVQSAVSGMSGIEELQAVSKETGLFWIIMEKIMIGLVIVGLAAVVIGGIAYLLYRLYKGFYAEKKDNTDEKEFLVGEIQWFPKGLFSGNKAAKEDKGSLNERIRKLYRRFVKKSFRRKESVPVALTPEEMLLFLKEKHYRKTTNMTDADWMRIREVYERARYGELDCTQEELDEMKRLVSSR